MCVIQIILKDTFFSPHNISQYMLYEVSII